MRNDLSQRTLEVYSKMYDVERKEGETDQELIERITIKACGGTHNGETSKQTKSEAKEIQTSDILNKLLNNPRVESISINIEKVGAVEQTHITANLKELKCLYLDESKLDDEEMKKWKEALKNMPPSNITIYNNGGYQPSEHIKENLNPPSTGSGIK